MIQAVLLALIAGYADTVGYLRYHAFAGLMTGNTILLGNEIAGGKSVEAMHHALIIAMFILGVMLAQILLRLRIEVWLALCLAAAILVVCGLVGPLAGSLLLALAMGLQNSAANRFNGVALNTVFITGNIQKLGEGILAWLWRDPAHKTSGGYAIYGYIWLAYLVGAALGAVAERLMGMPLLLPAGLLPLVMFPWNRLRPD